MFNNDHWDITATGTYGDRNQVCVWGLLNINNSFNHLASSSDEKQLYDKLLCYQ